MPTVPSQFMKASGQRYSDNCNPARVPKREFCAGGDGRLHERFDRIYRKIRPDRVNHALSSMSAAADLLSLTTSTITSRACAPAGGASALMNAGLM